VGYGYDNLGRLISASQPGQSLGFSYDALGRKLSESGPHGTVSSQYDIAGRRTRLTHPDGFTVAHDYLVTGEMTRIIGPSNDPFAPPPVLVTFGYDDLGRRTTLSRANGTNTSYGYDPVSRLSQLIQNPAGSTYDQVLQFGYNPASQIVKRTDYTDLYAWTGHGSGTLTTPANGLNQLTGFNGSGIGHDAKGNVTNDPAIGYGYGYSSENLLKTVATPWYTGTLTYDPLMRLYDSGTSARTSLLYDGFDRIAEYAGGTQRARFVHGPGVDEPLVEYTGPGLATRGFLHADERGTIIASSNDAGNVTAVGRYDEQGRIQSFAGNRFGFAGMPYETTSDLYYSRARMYNQRHPRFMQPDPIGYGDGMNMYNRTKGDPVNFVDPLGLADIEVCGGRRDELGRCVSKVSRPVVTGGAGLRVGGGSSGIDWSGSRGAVGGEDGGGSWGHKYTRDEPITKANTKCTAEQVGAVIQEFGVPGSDGPKVSGRNYPVHIERFGVNLVYVGDIRFNVRNGGISIVNTTRGGHWFHSGSVQLNGFGNDAGGYSLRIIGEGVNSGRFMAGANQAFGPGEFLRQAGKMRQKLKSVCGG
jgi:RHS repeat-associated protein